MLQEQAPQVYDGTGDALMQQAMSEPSRRIVLIPDSLPTKVPDPTRRIRILWGQHLLEDVLAGRYRTLVCAVNVADNRRGVIAQLAALIPTSQWDERTITATAAQFSAGRRVKVLTYDMDLVEVLAVVRPPQKEFMTLDDLSAAFKVIAEMIQHDTTRLPTASVSFLGARANRLVDARGNEPTFETVLRLMYDAGYSGDVYPSPALWQIAPTGVFSRYPFSTALDQMREGGF